MVNQAHPMRYGCKAQSDEYLETTPEDGQTGYLRIKKTPAGAAG